MSKKIQARLIIEIMGRPPEHIAETLQTLVVRLGSENGVSILEKSFFDPQPLEDTDNLFTAFAEVEAEFENTQSFFGIVFNYMPANVEILSPKELKTSSAELSELSNFILQRLHQYDAITKRVVGERDILLRQVKHLQGKGPGPENATKKDTPAKSTSKRKGSKKNTKKSSKKK